MTKYKTCYRRKLVCKQRCCSGYHLLNGRCEGNSILHPLCTLICMYVVLKVSLCDRRGSPTSAALVSPCWSSHPNAARNCSPLRKPQHLYYLLGPLFVILIFRHLNPITVIAFSMMAKNDVFQFLVVPSNEPSYDEHSPISRHLSRGI